MAEDKQSKFQLLVRMLTRLQSSQGLTVAELAQELGTSKRNIQRYLNDLRSFNYPVEEIHGQQPRYSVANQRQAGALLDLEETLALAMSVPLSDSFGLGEAARRGWDKLHYAVINGQEKRARNELPELLSAQFGWSLSAETMRTLSLALVEKRRLRVLYRNRDAVEAEWRLVEPRQMFFQDRWYVRVWDVDKQVIRNFRPDRIRDLELLTETFSIPQAEIGADPHFHKWDLAGDQPVEVNCRVSPPLAMWLQENPVHPSQRVEGTSFYVTVRDVDALISWILGLSHCRVLGPGWVLQRFRARVQALLD
jgi:predicted DNA-binding transcriptional regulator YafY